MIINHLYELVEIIEKHKQDGKKIVRTNWCFDILHPWHITSLQTAKKLWDILVVWINWDQSPYRQTKPNRPIHDEYFRVSMLDAIKYVDYVIVFNDETPLTYITQLLPNVLVKWADYSDITKIVWYDIVTAAWWLVTTIPLAESAWSKYSTTSIIAKIASLN